MVEYILMLNVLREQLVDEVFCIAKKLNRNLTNDDIAKYVKMILLNITEYGYVHQIDMPQAVKLENQVKNWM